MAGYAAALGRITHDRYPVNFHLKVESLSVRRSTTSQAYITAPLLVAAMNKQQTAQCETGAQLARGLDDHPLL